MPAMPLGKATFPMRLGERVPTDHALVAIVIAIAICARIVSFGYLSSLAAHNPSAYPYPVIPGDSVHYAHWADNILALHAYQDTPGVPLRAAPPGYPALLAGAKALTGSQSAIVVVQILFTCLALALIYTMARTLLPAYLAIVPALVYALDPVVILADTTLLTDGLFSALLVCIVYLAFFQERIKGLSRAALVGLLLGGAIMLRPIGEFLVFVFPALYILQEWMRKKEERENAPRLKMLGAFLAACAIVVVPWMARNELIFHSFEISPLGGHNLLTYDVRGFLAWRSLEGTAHPLPAILVLRHVNDPVFADVDKRIAHDLASITPPGQDPQSYEGALAVRYIAHDPLGYAYFDAVNTVPFFVASSLGSYGQVIGQLRNNTDFYAPTSLSILDAWHSIRRPENIGQFLGALRAIAPVALEIAWWVLVALAAVIGLWSRRRDFAVLLCAVLVLYFAVLTGPMAAARYRIPAEPYLLILAAAGAYAIAQRASGRAVNASLA